MKEIKEERRKGAAERRTGTEMYIKPGSSDDERTGPADRRQGAADPTLAELLERAKSHVITPEEREAQRHSWARGEMELTEHERGMTTRMPKASDCGETIDDLRAYHEHEVEQERLTDEAKATIPVGETCKTTIEVLRDDKVIGTFAITLPQRKVVMEYEVIADKEFAGDWRVEAINESGDVFVTMFSGPEAETRAKEYKAFKQVSAASRAPVGGVGVEPSAREIHTMFAVRRAYECLKAGSDYWALKTLEAAINDYDVLLAASRKYT